VTSSRADSKDPESRPSAERRRGLDLWIARVLPKLRAHVRLKTGPVLRSRESVSDIVQSALREACADREERAFANEASFRRYVYAVAARKIVSKSRRHRAEKRSPERELAFADREEARASAPSQSPSMHAERNEDLQRLARAFAELDETDQRILSMRRVFDVPVREIARELGMAESTVRWRLSVILANLASRMA